MESGQAGLLPGLQKAIVPALQDSELGFSFGDRSTQILWV